MSLFIDSEDAWGAEEKRRQLGFKSVVSARTARFLVTPFVFVTRNILLSILQDAPGVPPKVVTRQITAVILSFESLHTQIKALFSGLLTHPYRMTEYTPGDGQEVNSLLTDAPMVVPHYPSNEGASYVYSNGQVPYTHVNAVYPTYTARYSPNNDMPHFIPENSQMAVEYHQNSSHLTGSLTQPRTLAQTEYPASRSSTHRYSYANRAALQQDYYSMVDTEEQDSVNRESMLSEPVSPVLEGYPDVKEFDVLMRRYCCHQSANLLKC